MIKCHSKIVRVSVSAWALALALSYGMVAQAEYDLVLKGGRVIDPESGLNAIRDVAIRGDMIVEISELSLQGKETIDVSGKIVSPGFIDIHTHSPTPLGQYHQVMDGTTTALELEAGSYPIKEYGVDIRQQPLINFGSSAGYINMRILQKQGVRLAHIAGSPTPVGVKGYWTAFMSLMSEQRQGFEEQADEQDLKELQALLADGLKQGGLGIGLALDYMSEGVDAAEMRMIFDTAADHDAIIFVHMRRGVNGDPAGLYEVLDLVRETGVSLHICHIQHNAMRNIDLFLKEIANARSEGLDVTTELLPFNAGSAAISSAVFGRNWQEIFDISYEDVEWAATGERFTEKSWNEKRTNNPQGQVIHHYVKEEWTRRALAEPGVIIVTDLLPMMTRDSKVAPHNAAFTKVLSHYVRETSLLDIETAIKKMTLLPAMRLEKVAPGFKKKGRLQVGADADITVFDPELVKDNATYADPYRTADGISLVIVNGTPVVREGELVENTYPGREILGQTLPPTSTTLADENESD
jgi:N-acyl-D-aspartate/D-glutamate deacylase